MRQWVADFALGHSKLFFTELQNKIRFHFLQLLAKFLSKFWIIIFFIFYNLKKKKSEISLVCPSPIQQPTVSPKYSQSIKVNIGPSDGGTIISSSHRPTVLYWRLSDFKSTLFYTKKSGTPHHKMSDLWWTQSQKGSIIETSLKTLRQSSL